MAEEKVKISSAWKATIFYGAFGADKHMQYTLSYYCISILKLTQKFIFLVKMPISPKKGPSALNFGLLSPKFFPTNPKLTVGRILG